MGSIEGLRSEALALRAREDTNVQISSHLGSVNKTLGGQITSMIDQLQGVINSRTKAYNALVSKLNKEINGAGGIGDQGIKATFQVVTTTITIASAVEEGSASASAIAKSLLDVAALVTGFLGAQQSVKSAVLDYKKEISQIGYSDVDQQNTGFTSAGASGEVQMRDDLLPRYKAHQPSTFATRGYVGTLRRI